MLLQVAQDVPMSTRVGEWAAGPLLICVGVGLILHARHTQAAAVADGTSRKHTFGIVLLFVGGALLAVHALQAAG